MKKLPILFINLFFSAPVLAQEISMYCELDAVGGSMPGFVAHGFITLLFFVLSMKWALRSKAGMKSTDRIGADITEEFKRAA